MPFLEIAETHSYQKVICLGIKKKTKTNLFLKKRETVMTFIYVDTYFFYTSNITEIKMFDVINMLP